MSKEKYVANLCLAVWRADLASPGSSMKKKMIFTDATPRKEEDTKTKTIDGVKLQNRMSTEEGNIWEGEIG